LGRIFVDLNAIYYRLLASVNKISAACLFPAARRLLSINFYQDNGANDLSVCSHKLQTTSVLKKTDVNYPAS
jgi:hypothetical protein